MVPDDQLHESPSLSRFIHAFWESWGLLMTGGFSIPFSAFAVFSSGSERIVWAVAAVLSAIEATYLVWAKERKKLVELQTQMQNREIEFQALKSEFKKFKSSNEPSILGEVGAFNTGDLDGSSRIAASMHISLRSLGVETALERWSLSVRHNNIRYNCPKLYVKNMNCMMPDGSSAMITGEDLIERKSLKPIPKNGILRGWMIAELPPHMGHDQVGDEGTEFYIRFSDVFGNPYEIVSHHNDKGKPGFGFMLDDAKGY